MTHLRHYRQHIISLHGETFEGRSFQILCRGPKKINKKKDLWRLAPGHLGAIVSVATAKEREEQYYRAKMARFRSLSHLTIEVRHINPAATPSIA
jgi:hypothetical protein